MGDNDNNDDYEGDDIDALEKARVAEISGEDPRKNKEESEDSNEE